MSRQYHVYIMASARNGETMRLEDFRNSVQELPARAAHEWRDRFVAAFVATTSKFYKEHVEALKVYSDGRFYSGYLWDCIRPLDRISCLDLITELQRLNRDVMVMWDLHSQDKIPVPDYWKFGRDATLLVNSRQLSEALDHLPEDIYIFDQSLTWALVATHEHDDDGQRICARSASMIGRPRVTH